ncbi:MAG: TIGR02147 family protein [Acidobacteria bacterium]|nr:TIGR02147 family protein [Acidobacteriota bacterium]
MKTNITTLLQQPTPSSSFRLYLQAELARRCAANQQYSLRSFALQLGINHSTLSQLLRGKRPLTARTIEKLGQRLGLGRTEIESFVAGASLAGSGATAASSEIRQLTFDTVALLSDLSHRSILELTRLDEFVADTRWIARVLNLSVDEVNVALQRLLRLDLLEMTDHKRWLDKSGVTEADQDEFARLVIQRLSEQVRKLSITHGAGDDQTVASTTRITIKSTDLPLVTEMIERLQRQSSESLDDDEYQLEINLHPINHYNQTKE